MSVARLMLMTFRWLLARQGAFLAKVYKYDHNATVHNLAYSVPFTKAVYIWFK